MGQKKEPIKSQRTQLPVASRQTRTGLDKTCIYSVFFMDCNFTVIIYVEEMKTEHTSTCS